MSKIKTISALALSFTLANVTASFANEHEKVDHKAHMEAEKAEHAEHGKEMHKDHAEGHKHHKHNHEAK